MFKCEQRNCKDLEGNMGQRSTQKRCYILLVINKIIVRAKRNKRNKKIYNYTRIYMCCSNFNRHIYKHQQNGYNTHSLEAINDKQIVT